MSWPATRRGTGGMLPNIICSIPAGYENRVGRQAHGEHTVSCGGGVPARLIGAIRPPGPSGTARR
jgi:hypothetical protein